MVQCLWLFVPVIIGLRDERVCLLPSGAQEHIALLKCAGILDEDGQLAQRYRAGLEGEADCSPRAAGTAS